MDIVIAWLKANQTDLWTELVDDYSIGNSLRDICVATNLPESFDSIDYPENI